MQLNELLEEEANEAHFLVAESSVENAIAYMAERHIDALIITRGKQPIGIFTERDLIRCHTSHRGRPLEAINIQEVMTNKLIVAEAHERVGAALAMMIKAGVSHLPVLRGGAVVALVSLRDLAQQHVHSIEAELKHLQDYMADFHEASRD
jgi:IMP dehydrogenase